MHYDSLSAAERHALVGVEAHHHLPRIQDAGRMWLAVAERLRDLADSLRRELAALAPDWADSTGTGFVAEVERRKAVIDAMVARIEERQPWRALDDLARQLMLTHARLTGCDPVIVPEGVAVDLDELDRYFEAAARAVFECSGVEDRLPEVTMMADDEASCCSGPGLAGLTSGGPPVLAAPAGVGGAPPSGGVSVPGLVAIPPSGLRGVGPGKARSGPPSIDQAARPVVAEVPPPAQEAPRLPQQTAVTSQTGTSTGGRFFPPMMMPPMLAGTANRASRTSRTVGGEQRPARGVQPVPGVPARLSGRAGDRVRPPTRRTEEPPDGEVLDHEVWQVREPGAASPLRPERPAPGGARRRTRHDGRTA
ncbi:WXG100 family type VII secretion target [Actinokineospora sp. UTMC 2448]|uniref:WXG100 family type VII secretion target n=1 Tax=Actinokineospora sp. UTMC 2448 TaxID=2268449 RepID=UPI002163FF9A|nr:hypothetical protein [Actinokineospora sp. UTMC 2448]UVS79623.1 hypothetical protein Actkin_03373 [Actinokineospora sp. UTMC 2448]